MKQRVLNRVTLSMIVLLVAASGYAQGLYWESVTTGGPGGVNGQKSEFYYMPRMFKNVESNRQEEIIFRLDKDMMIHLDHGKKTYYEISFDEMERMMKKAGAVMDEQMAKLQEQMASMPEEQRKMMEKMMGKTLTGGKGNKLELRKTSDAKSISGYACKKYVVMSGDEPAYTMWVTKDLKEFAGMQKDMQEFGKRMAAITPRFAGEIAEGMKNLDGFPVQTEIGGITTTVSKVERRTTPKSEFEVPAGYKKEKPEMFEQMEKMGH